MASDYLEWKPISKDLPLLGCKYTFGGGEALALAAPCEGGCVVVSPPCNPKDATFTGVESLGKVRAIVAPNGFHNLGLQAWKERFPDALMLAPAQSIKRIEKKAGVSGVKPLADAASLTGPDLELIDMPHYKTGEVLVRYKNGDQLVWYVTDVIMNLKELPPKFPFNLMFKWTKSAPGLRPSGIAAMFMVKDKASLYRWIRAELDAHPPTALVPCHGDAVLTGAADRLREVFPS